MSNNIKHDVSVIEGKPILILKFVDNLTLNDVEQVTERLMSLTENLKPYFCIITDLRQLNTIEESGKSKISEMMLKLSQRGLKWVARVFPGGDEQAINTFIEAGSTTPYTASYFSSMEKAIAFAETITSESAEANPDAP